MNREQAKQLLPIIQAFADGADVQFQTPRGNWLDADAPCFSPLDTYRIKPKPAECWIVHRAYCDGTTDFGFGYDKREDAQNAANLAKTQCRVVHMVEVTE